MSDVIVLPVYNNATAASEKAPVLADENYDDIILVVDDGSTDNLSDLIETAPNLHYLQHERSLGFGGILISSVEYAIAHHYENLYMLDVTQSSIFTALKLLRSTLNKGFDLVTLSRFEQDDQSGDYATIVPGRIISHHLKETTSLAYSDFFSPLKAIRMDAINDFVLEEFDEAIFIQLWIQSVYYKIKLVEIYNSECLNPDASHETFENNEEHYINFIKGESLLYPL
jgi:glycosyltransferase involved in cell wall biosynthesis